MGRYPSTLIPEIKSTPEEAHSTYIGLKQWLKALGIKENLRKKGFVDGDVTRLTDLAFETPSLGLLLSMVPIEASRETVAAIYADSL